MLDELLLNNRRKVGSIVARFKSVGGGCDLMNFMRRKDQGARIVKINPFTLGE